MVICCFISRSHSSVIMKCCISGNICKIATFRNSNCYICGNTGKILLFETQIVAFVVISKNWYFYTENATALGKSTNLLLLA